MWESGAKCARAQMADAGQARFTLAVASSLVGSHRDHVNSSYVAEAFRAKCASRETKPVSDNKTPGLSSPH